jgi:dipeptidyl aminopeptidase/acylaminoacyl peptidase
VRGSFSPRWSPAGHRLFFADYDGRIWYADYETSGDSFSAGKPQLWNDKPTALPLTVAGGGNFDVSRDGNRVLALIDPDSPQDRQDAHVTIVAHFFDELKRRLP